MLREEEDTEEKKKIEEQEKKGKGVSEDDKESEFGILVKNLVEEEYQIRA